MACCSRSRPTCWCRGPDTELLVDWALRAAGARCAAPAAVLDLGTGSGAIALASSTACPARARDGHRRQRRARWRSRARNAARLGLAVEFVAGVLVAGAATAVASTWSSPTRPTSPPATRTWQPCATSRGTALTPGGDGLAALRDDRRRRAGAPARRRLAAARARLRPGRRRPRAAAPTPASSEVETRRDLAGHARATGGRRPAAATP